MSSVHLIITDLFLPDDIAAEVCRDLYLPALEKILARGQSGFLQDAGLEGLLCKIFGLCRGGGFPIAPISALFDGLGEGCWLRADPVHLRLQRDQLVLLPDVEVSPNEAAQICASLNEHFAGQGMEFLAPHPQRWYVRLERLPGIEATPLSQAIGRNVHDLLPKGAEALRWHQLFNEIQMLLFSHPVNELREARGDLTVNSLWFWGGGCDTLLMKPLASRLGEQSTLAKSLVMAKPADCGSSRHADSVTSDNVLAEMFAAAANIPYSEWLGQWRKDEGSAAQLLVWTGLSAALRRGDLNGWRAALSEFEAAYAQPLWHALRSGAITELTLDASVGNGIRRLSLKRADAWAFWRRPKPLAAYSMV